MDTSALLSCREDSERYITEGAWYPHTLQWQHCYCYYNDRHVIGIVLRDTDPLRPMGCSRLVSCGHRLIRVTASPPLWTASSAQQVFRK